MALNGGPEFTFSEVISFVVNCEDQKEIDEFWEKLSSGGRIQQCGWLKDKFGLSWQIVPVVLERLINDGTPERSERVMNALFKMIKINIAELEKAFNGEEKAVD